MDNFIKIRGARHHNLKNIDLDIPRDQLVVITGLSGSGKSSLAFDTIYAEGQRRYVESLSSYARMFLGVMDKPDVDTITGLSPAISIDQKSTSKNPRSTVATVTEVYDYLRLLFARTGVPHCPICHKTVSRRSVEDIVNEVMKLPLGSKLILLAPIVQQKKGEFLHLAEQYQSKGFSRIRVDGLIYALDEFPTLEKQIKHDIEIVVDRFVLSPDLISRISGSIEQALELGQGIIKLLQINNNSTAVGQDTSTLGLSESKIYTFSQRYACEDHPGELIPELEPRLFSFNSPQGACPTCTGLGTKMEIDPSLVLNPSLTIAEGGIRPFNRVTHDSWWLKRLKSVADQHGFSVHVPIRELDPEAIQKVLYGTGDQKYQVKISGSGKWSEGAEYQSTYEGVIPTLERRHRETDSDFIRKDIERFMRVRTCQACQGARLKPAVLAVTINNLNIVEICSLDVDSALKLLANFDFSSEAKIIAEPILKEIRERIKFMQDVGLGYLELGRTANTLSGGEAQRIRLATQIGSGLQGVLYVLDEPSIGLHQRDNDKLINTLKHLRDLKNTVLVVEHDEDTMLASDYIIDIGPGAGQKGGSVVATGTPAEIMQNKNSLTGRYLSGQEQITVPKKRRKPKKEILTIYGAKENNLKNLDVSFPLGVMTVVSGVSGSGKSTLINNILANELQARLHRAQTVPGSHDRIEGIEYLDKVIVIDQSPIGRTPRSNAATYTGVFNQIRELFAAQPESEIRGYKPGRFSFNVKGGRCETCQGDGVNKIEMHFLPDVFVTCPVCQGKRYNREALEVKYKGKNISEVLNFTVDEAADFFANIPAISTKLNTLKQVGLGYIRLGQSATTFSGGEAQRIKLATELSRRSTGRTLYILDEPTTGLHTADVKRLLSILNQLVDGGNTMIVIEHNLHVIKSADFIIDMGPEGGSGGGRVIASGTPEQVAKNPDSPTGQFLEKIL